MMPLAIPDVSNKVKPPNFQLRVICKVTLPNVKLPYLLYGARHTLTRATPAQSSNAGAGDRAGSGNRAGLAPPRLTIIPATVRQGSRRIIVTN
jgi:hypothetical protein